MKVIGDLLIVLTRTKDWLDTSQEWLKDTKLVFVFSQNDRKLAWSSLSLTRLFVT